MGIRTIIIAFIIVLMAPLYPHLELMPSKEDKEIKEVSEELVIYEEENEGTKKELPKEKKEKELLEDTYWDRG